MPAKNDPSAPRFDSSPKCLQPFFDEVEYLATEAGLHDTDKIQQSLHYASTDDVELWNLLTESRQSMFSVFHTAVLQIYPGSDDDRRYSTADLQQFIHNQQKQTITTQIELGQYHQDFLCIAIFLHDHGRIADNEWDRAYLNGIHAELQAQVQARLQLHYPDHYDDDLYPFGVIFDAALFIPISHRQSSDTIPIVPKLSQQPSELTAVLPVSTTAHASHPNDIIPKSTPIAKTIV
jgi:hypothetical protein